MDQQPESTSPENTSPETDTPICPKCGGEMWDNRESKRNPRAPDFKCRNKPKMQGGPGCEGVIWPPRDGEQRAGGAPAATAPRRSPAAQSSPPPMHDVPPIDDYPGGHPDDDDDLPF